MKRTDKRTKRDDTPQLEIDEDTGELYTQVGMLKKEWADAARKIGAWNTDAPECSRRNDD